MSLAQRDRTEWLEWRRQGIGGSDAAAIAGLSPWKSPYELWLEKTGQLPDQAGESEAMRWGTLLEPVIADEFERRSELKVISRQLCVEHPRDPWRRATLDGIVLDTDQGPDGIDLGVYEGKTTSQLRWALDWSEGLPAHYALQVQHQLAVAGYDRAWVTCLIGGQTLRVLEVERDEPAIDLLLELEFEFWERVGGRLPPPPVDGSTRTAAAIRDAFRASTPGRVIDLTDELRPSLNALLEWRAAAKRAEQEITKAQNELMAAIGDAEVAWLDGQEVITWREHEDRRIDTKALRAAEPEVAERFTRTKTVRTFLVKG